MPIYELLRRALRFMRLALERGYGMTIVLIPPDRISGYFCPCCGDRIRVSIEGAAVIVGNQCHNRACASRRLPQGPPTLWALTETAQSTEEEV